MSPCKRCSVIYFVISETLQHDRHVRPCARVCDCTYEELREVPGLRHRLARLLHRVNLVVIERCAHVELLDGLLQERLQLLVQLRAEITRSRSRVILRQTFIHVFRSCSLCCFFPGVKQISVHAIRNVEASAPERYTDISDVRCLCSGRP